jgi:phosphosulfolactate synthase
MTGFLTLPERSERPRQTGITHVLDKGLTVNQIDGIFDLAGGHIDLVKLGWGTCLVTENLPEKIAKYRERGATVVLGGTFFEICLAQGKVDEWRQYVRDLGLTHVEVSDGTVQIERDVKLAYIRDLAKEFTVLSEVGSKDAATVIAPYLWVEIIQGELEAGAWKVITEARESGTAGIFRGDGEVRMGLIDEIVHKIDKDRLIFEAPQKSQQVWFIKSFGANVNLGNIPPEEVIALESLRLGLRSDTLNVK